MTKTILTKERTQAAHDFIEANARPLEVARLHFHFNNAPTDVVLEALCPYQNSDGGFGHALECDFRAPDSSVLCTSIAFQIFRLIGVGHEVEMVANALQYLLGTFSRENITWRIIPPVSEEHPHAPWWNQGEDTHLLDNFSLNPTVEILGYLYENQEHVPSEMIALTTDRICTHLAHLDEIEMHDLLCCLRLLDTPNLPVEIKAEIQNKLAALLDGTIETEPEKWAGYNLRPLQVIHSPNSPFINGLEAALSANLDYEIASQGKDGSWGPPWSWGDTFPDDWTKARQEWAGVLTLERLLLLQRFNRIEEI